MYSELNEEMIKEISQRKGEPAWMLEFRLKSLNKFLELGMPKFGPKLDIDFSSINYYKKVGNLLQSFSRFRKWQTMGSFC